MKKIIFVILSVIIAATAFAGCSAKNETKTAETSTKEAASEIETGEAEKITEESATKEATSEKVSENETEAPVTAPESYESLRDGVWYYYLDDSNEAYAFEFTGKDRVEITYFSPENTGGLDTKTSSTSEDYEVNDVEGTLIVEIAVPFKDNEEFMFNIKNGRLCAGKDELPNEKEVSLETVFNHFNG